MLLDYKYIAALAIRAQNNDSIAFTELYALTHQKEYAFACNYLKDPVLAQFPGCILLIFESAIQCWKRKKIPKKILEKNLTATS